MYKIIGSKAKDPLRNNENNSVCCQTIFPVKRSDETIPPETLTAEVVPPFWVASAGV